jgi:N-acetylglucosaminyldiphosphoundecaprenol N-acetyl-beta-D-mannosaminyltransferase
MTQAATKPARSNSENAAAPNNAEIAKMDAQFSSAGLLRRRIRRNTLTAALQVILSASAIGKRLSDVVLTALVLIILSPLLVAITLALALSGGAIFTNDTRVGRWAAPFALLRFNTNKSWARVLRRLRFDRIPVLINVVRGEMSLIGPTPLRPEELDIRQRSARKRSSVRPGLLSLWWLRKKANIHFGSELDIDIEYVDRQTVSGDLGIALRAIPSLLYGSSSAVAPDHVDVLGIQVDNFTMEEALQYVLEAAVGSTPRQLCFVNTDCVNKSVSDQAYRALLDGSDLTLADGIGIRIAGKITRREIRQNVNGTDMLPLLCQRLQGSQLGLFFLGARAEVVDAFASWVRNTYPSVHVKGYHDGYFDASQEGAVLTRIQDSGAEILLVAFGAPRQDIWIGKHLHELGKVRIAMGVGGLFDFYSGRIPRAPQWMRELSLEWAYRLYQEPGRMWRRYLLGNVIFLTRVALFTVFRRSAKRSSVQA